MAVVRRFIPAVVGSLLWASQAGAQGGSTGTITGRVVDAASQERLSDASVTIEGTRLGTLTRSDGSFNLVGIPAGTVRLRAARIGYAPLTQEVTVTAGSAATVQFALSRQAVQLGEVVTVGYGTQRREAITGSVASVNAEEANVGVVSNVNNMITGRVPGVQMTLNSGEPGAGAQVRIRGGTSISASNEPLYVIDGVPVSNDATEAGGIGIGGGAALPRSPLNLLNPSDIESITILKDASSTAIYGARGANGVILIETKKGSARTTAVEYDGYVASATPRKYLDLLNGNEYRAFIQQAVQQGKLTSDRLQNLGTANTDWEREVTRTAATHNHNVSFTGGGGSTRYRASLNYMDQQGVTLDNGFKRLQGRLNGTHSAVNDKLRLSLNMTTSRLDNDYLAYENTGGFEGGVFTNVAIFNPTRPVRVKDAATGQMVYYETGTGRLSVRNPVALAEQILDESETMRTLGNTSAEYDLLPWLTARMNLGLDRSEGNRKSYFPRVSPVGAEWNGRARQVNRDLTTRTLQSLLTARQQFFGAHDFDIVGGYEYTDYEIGEFGAEGRGYITDAFGFNNLGGGSELIRPFSWREDSRLVSFFSRANWSYGDKYFLTGVVRKDGSSRFGTGNKWATFPAISGSWRISEEPFGKLPGVSDLRLRVGYGLQGNPAVPPYASLILLETTGGARYVFGEAAVTGIAPVRNPNPNLKWEETQQTNFAVDYGFLDNRFRGSVEYYVKNTKDLLLTVSVPQPALVGERLENIGRIRNKGLEFSLDAEVFNRPTFTWTSGLVFSAERNTVVDLGGRSFINTGWVSGQGQSGQVSQRIQPGYALGTFFGPEFVSIDAQGKQVFNKYTVTRNAEGVVTSRTRSGTTTAPGGDDIVKIGDANPAWTFGLRNSGNWRKFDLSFLVRGEMGRDVFNNTNLVYATQSNAKQDKNFLRSALNDKTGINEPAIYSSRWIEDGSFVRLQNITLGYTFDLPMAGNVGRNTRAYISGDNLWVATDYSGYDPEVHVESGLASRGIDYLSYPRPRTFTAGLRLAF